MSAGRKRRGRKQERAWRALTGCLAAFVLVMALFDPVFAGAAPVQDEIQYQEKALSAAQSDESGQGLRDSLSQALACHIYFEHHQLVRAESTFAVPLLPVARARYLMRVMPLDSIEPYPLRRPPRA
ncbi:MAG TPA: hypothetical protein VFF88_07365 [Methylocella sp.]|nr:hypothetical protein [Methylocella sp.]